MCSQRRLHTKASTPVSKIEGTISGDSCAVWDFSAPSVEADRLADFVAKQMAEHKLAPRDFSAAVLVQQELQRLLKLLEPAFVKGKSSFATKPCKSGRFTCRNSLPRTSRTTSWLFCGFLRASGPGVIGRRVSTLCAFFAALLPTTMPDAPARSNSLAPSKREFRKTLSGSRHGRSRCARSDQLRAYRVPLAKPISSRLHPPTAMGTGSPMSARLPSPISKPRAVPPPLGGRPSTSTRVCTPSPDDHS